MAEGRTFSGRAGRYAVMEKPMRWSETDLLPRAMEGRKSKLRPALSLLAIVLAAVAIWHQFTPPRVGGKRLGQEAPPVGVAKVTKGGFSRPSFHNVTAAL